jgi:addiction module RelE/StbE family toxin
MVQIEWTIAAKNDLKSISDYISKDSPKYARRQIYSIYQKVETLKKLSIAGKVVNEFNDETIREIIEGNYRIIYKQECTEKIYILTIHHGARDLIRRKII